jgi:hypothetical protein
VGKGIVFVDVEEISSAILFQVVILISSISCFRSNFISKSFVHYLVF